MKKYLLWGLYLALAFGFFRGYTWAIIRDPYVGCEPIDAFAQRIVSCKGRGCDHMGPTTTTTTISYLCGEGVLKTKTVSGTFTLEQIIRNQESEKFAVGFTLADPSIYRVGVHWVLSKEDSDEDSTF